MKLLKLNIIKNISSFHIEEGREQLYPLERWIELKLSN